MNVAYVYDGQLFTTVESFLEAMAHEYKVGDSENVIDTLEDYGFSLEDINVRPSGA